MHCGKKAPRSLHLDGQQRVILTASVKRPCKGAASAGTPPLTDFFARQMSVENSHTQQGTAPMDEGVTHPTPRRLHFATPLTQAEDQGTPAQAMNFSLEAGQHLTRHGAALHPSTGLASTAYALPTLFDSSTRLRATGHDNQPPSPQQPITPNSHGWMRRPPLKWISFDPVRLLTRVKAIGHPGLPANTATAINSRKKYIHTYTHTYIHTYMAQGREWFEPVPYQSGYRLKP